MKLAKLYAEVKESKSPPQATSDAVDQNYRRKETQTWFPSQVI